MAKSVVVVANVVQIWAKADIVKAFPGRLSQPFLSANNTAIWFFESLIWQLIKDVVVWKKFVF